MTYLYYPGCSLKGTAPEYDLSTQAVMKALALELMELEDWTCCGASAAETVSPLLSLVLPARNLALAEVAGQGPDGGNGARVQVIAACSACYVNLRKVEERVHGDPDSLNRINQVLSAEGLQYAGRTKVRHLLDVIASDAGPDAIAAKITHPLTGLKVAPYYGCQTVRPYCLSDAPPPFEAHKEFPELMNGVLDALGADVQPNPMQAACCGGTLMTTKRAVGVQLISELLQSVDGADCLVTVCPLCHMNLEAYQKLVSKNVGRVVRMPILYLTQLLGMALGLPSERLGLRHNLMPLEPVRQSRAPSTLTAEG